MKYILLIIFCSTATINALGSHPKCDSIHINVGGNFEEPDSVVLIFKSGLEFKVQYQRSSLFYGYINHFYLSSDKAAKLKCVQINNNRYLVNKRLKCDNDILFKNGRIKVVRRKHVSGLL